MTVDSFSRLAASTVPSQPSTTSDGMFGDNNGDSAYYHKQRMKTATLEDWDAGMELMFPGSAALMKRLTVP
jgi:hypothetical protein